MKAITYQKYGTPDLLTMNEVEKPSPEANQVLIRIKAAAVNKADWHLLKGEPFPVRLMAGLFKPKNQILGADVAGVVEQVGEEVSQFKVGDEVFGDLSATGFGGFAEYALTTPDKLAKKPSNLSFEEAAALPMAAGTALQGLRDKGQIKAGQKVLINGASGGVGTFAVQIAKAFGAEVTAVCSSSKIEMARSLGADKVIDYTQEDFTQGTAQYDLIFDIVANHSISALKKVLKPNGRYVACAFSIGAMLWGPWIALTEKKTMISMLASVNAANHKFLAEWAAVGKIKPVIDKQFELEQVPEAMWQIGKGGMKGKLVVLL